MTYFHLEKEVEFDLEWLFCRSMADIGIKSNWCAMVSVSQFGSSTNFIDNMNTFTLNCVERQNQLSKIYYKLSESTQDILYASFADIYYSPHIEIIFKKLSGTACFLSNKTPDQFIKLCQAVRLGLATKDEKKFISELRTKTQNTYQDALQEYIHEKKRYFHQRKSNGTKKL